MKYFIILLLFVQFSIHGFSQKTTEKTHRGVNLHFPDSSISASVLNRNVKIKLDEGKIYYWYYNNAIHQNQGGYKGHLLDGNFDVTTKHGGLISNGVFVKGVKDAKWKHWDDEGNLTAIYKWVKGNKEGRYIIYQRGFIIEKGEYVKNKKNGAYQKFSEDKLIEEGAFKKGFLEGKIITYSNDIILSKKKYKKGVLIKAKIKTDKKEKDTEEVKEKKTPKSWMFWKKNNEKKAPITEEGKANRKEEKRKPKKEKKKKTAKKNKKDA